MISSYDQNLNFVYEKTQRQTLTFRYDWNRRSNEEKEKKKEEQLSYGNAR